MPEAQLQQRNILWTSVTSAGQHLPLPLDSCCSVSLVSRVHADFIASKRPNLKYCPLEEPFSVTATYLKSNIKAVATMEIPITWETKTETVFTMIVIPVLVWPMLFGENHLHVTHLWLIIMLRPSRFGIQVCSFMSKALSIIHSKAWQPLQHPMGPCHMKVDLQCQSHMSVLHAFLLEHHH